MMQKEQPQTAPTEKALSDGTLRWIILTAILVLAVFARLWHIDQFPVGHLVR